MPINFSWVEEGVLAGMGRPMGSPNELQDLRDMDIAAIVSLTETPLSPILVEEFGFEYRHLPIADFAPPTLAQVHEFVAFVRKMRDAKRPVDLHCGAGVGRTGTMLACYLVAEGDSGDDAIARIRMLRPGSVETYEQELIVQDYEHALAVAKSRKQAKKRSRTRKKRRK